MGFPMVFRVCSVYMAKSLLCFLRFKAVQSDGFVTAVTQRSIGCIP